MSYTNRFILGLAALCLVSGSLVAQEMNPAAREDAAIEREKMLRAADSVDILTSRLEKLEALLTRLQTEVNDLKGENSSLKQQLAMSDDQRAKEREVILTEVAKTVSQATKDVARATPPPAPPASSDSTPASSTASKPSEKGYEHVVEKGQTLWIIAKAYQEQGVKVSIDEIQRANGLKNDSVLKVGQKLFIPATTH